MRHASLFSGIGGFDLAAWQMGWSNVFHCEKDPFCRRILQYYWPKAKSYEDVKDFRAIEYRGRVDILSAGFPCQPFSVAGKRKGEADDRFLWPETIRIIKDIRPKWIVLENVTGLLTVLEQEGISEMEVQAAQLFGQNKVHGSNTVFINTRRRIIGVILEEITAAGYLLPRLVDGTPIILCIPACAVGAPHKRDRLWMVAYRDFGSDSARKGESDQRRSEGFKGRAGILHEPDGPGIGGPFADAYFQGLEGCQKAGNIEKTRKERNQQFAGLLQCKGWENFPTQSPLCWGNDGVPAGLDGITLPQLRQKSIKAYGNAIIPLVAFEIFSAIAALEN